MIKRIKKFISAKLLSIAYDLDYDEFLGFCCDNGFNFCEDCDERIKTW